jgi:hypothetical protein
MPVLRHRLIGQNVNRRKNSVSVWITDNKVKLGTLGALVGAGAGLVAIATAFALVVWNIATLSNKAEGLERRVTELEVRARNIPPDIAKEIAGVCGGLAKDVALHRNNAFYAQEAGNRDQVDKWNALKAMTIVDMRNLGCAPPATASERK